MANSKKTSDIFVGLDIGTSCIKAVVTRKNPEGGLDLIGLGVASNTGMRKGEVQNIEATERAIRQAVIDAERMSGVKIKSVCVGISGGHINSTNSKGIVAVRGGEVVKSDVDRVLESAAAANIPVGYDVLHIIPQQYKLDGQGDIKNPIGMTGVRLEVEVLIVRGAVSSAANITRACSKAGLDVDDIVLDHLASSEAVLSDDEREIGTCLIDGGAGTTNLAVFSKGAAFHTAVLQLGGINFTSDLHRGLQITESEAEKLKISHGCIWIEKVSPEETATVKMIGKNHKSSISRVVITQILQYRADEIFTMLAGELQVKKLYNYINAGIVVTGGIANFDGIEELATAVMGRPARIGIPQNIGGLSDLVSDPAYSTAVGLAIMHSKKGNSHNTISGGEEDIFTRVAARMKGFLGEFF
ncbi:MAG: cell division protein FtsA [Deferribacteraceae bacterium]|nr:cell division protein FtsA [Deferribacteraceae bacterium]